VHPPGTVGGIELIDIFSKSYHCIQVCISLTFCTARRKATLIARLHHIFPNENLIYHGYLGCSPVYPTVAISLHTLAAFRQAHRACPRFSIQAQCKALCHLHNVSQTRYYLVSSVFTTKQVPYCPYLFYQFSHAFDIYLEIVHRVNQDIRVALNHNTQDWRLQNECPVCFYCLEDEPKLSFDWLVSVDGNNSLKQWDTTLYGTVPRVDHRAPRSTYWLSNEEVDHFKYEVTARQVCAI